MYNPLLNQQKSFPTINIGDIILREQNDEDINNFFQYYSNPQVTKYILCHIPTNLEEARKELSFWRNIYYRGDGVYYAITLKKNNEMIGTIGLSGYNSYQSRIEVSYDLSQKYWRKGIMSAALKKVISYGFNNFAQNNNRRPINRIEAYVATENDASKNLLIKCGFEVEGILRQHRYHKGKYVDVFCLSILRQDFEKLYGN